MAADFFTLQNWELFPSLSYVQEITEKQQLVNETSIQQDLDWYGMIWALKTIGRMLFHIM